MFVLNNVLCNETFYTKGQKVNKTDANIDQLKKDGLLVDKDPNEVATIVGSDSKELAVALEESTNSNAQLAKALADANDKVNALEDDKAKFSQELADIAQENAELAKALAEATK